MLRLTCLVVYRSCARARRAKWLVSGGLNAIARDREDGRDHEQPGLQEASPRREGIDAANRECDCKPGCETDRRYTCASVIARQPRQRNRAYQPQCDRERICDKATALDALRGSSS